MVEGRIKKAFPWYFPISANCKALHIDDVQQEFCHTFFVLVKKSSFVSCVVW
jgi:hypothetical protein